MNWFVKFFKSFFSIFRDGLEKFLTENIPVALQAAQDVLVKGGFSSTKEFADLLWQELSHKFPNIAGTWVTILANLAVDAFKKQGKL